MARRSSTEATAAANIPYSRRTDAELEAAAAVAAYDAERGDVTARAELDRIDAELSRRAQAARDERRAEQGRQMLQQAEKDAAAAARVREAKRQANAIAAQLLEDGAATDALLAQLVEQLQATWTRSKQYYAHHAVATGQANHRYLKRNLLAIYTVQTLMRALEMSVDEIPKTNYQMRLVLMTPDGEATNLSRLLQVPTFPEE